MPSHSTKIRLENVKIAVYIVTKLPVDSLTKARNGLNYLYIFKGKELPALQTHAGYTVLFRLDIRKD
jgi:hypothetical protein